MGAVGVGDGGVLQQHGLDFAGSDLGAAEVDDIVGAPLDDQAALAAKRIAILVEEDFEDRERPLLIELLKQPEENQPKVVYKAAAQALGQIGDAEAVSELIAVQFRVADIASTDSIAEIAIQAIGAIGARVVRSSVTVRTAFHATISGWVAPA